MASRNQVLTSTIGLVYYDTVTLAVIRRNVSGEPRLVHGVHPLPAGDLPGPVEALLNFQTMIADLTALPWAGASPAG